MTWLIRISAPTWVAGAVANEAGAVLHVAPKLAWARRAGARALVSWARRHGFGVEVLP